MLHLLYFVYVFHIFFQLLEALFSGSGPLYFPETAGRAKNFVFCMGVKLEQVQDIFAGSPRDQAGPRVPGGRPCPRGRHLSQGVPPCHSWHNPCPGGRPACHGGAGYPRPRRAGASASTPCRGARLISPHHCTPLLSLHNNN